jgi:hypothetical protein
MTCGHPLYNITLERMIAYRRVYGETAPTETHGIRLLFGAECREWSLSSPRESLDHVFSCHIGLG